MIKDVTQHLGVLLIFLHIPHAQSLKDKRMILKSLKDRVRLKFNVSVAELGQQDKWQTALVGFTMIGNDNRYMDSCLQNILSFFKNFDSLEICDSRIESL